MYKKNFLLLFTISLCSCAFTSPLGALPVYEKRVTPKFYEYRADKVSRMEGRWALILMDGSQWIVHPSDVQTLRAWSYEDRLVLTPHHPWGGADSYSYRLRNEDLALSVRVSPLLGPSLDQNPYLIRVVGFDRRVNGVSLSNGTLWRIDRKDQALFDSWQIGDVIMFGTNDRWLSLYDHILLNTAQSTYVQATQL